MYYDARENTHCLLYSLQNVNSHYKKLSIHNAKLSVYNESSNSSHNCFILMYAITLHIIKLWYKTTSSSNIIYSILPIATG